jgi:hypothetical protein
MQFALGLAVRLTKCVNRIAQTSCARGQASSGARRGAGTRSAFKRDRSKTDKIDLKASRALFAKVRALFFIALSCATPGC